MDPRTLTRAARDEIRTILGDPALCGERLTGAIRGLGERLAIEPFRACLGVIAPLDRPEPAAQRLICSIERHRSLLCKSLGRDPGFGIAAIDYLHDVGLIHDPLPAARRRDATAGRGQRARATAEPLQRALVLDLRRCERVGRPLAFAVLRPDSPSAGRRRLPAAAAAQLQAAVRDVDHAARILPEGFAVVLPCTSGQGGVTTADRLRLMLSNAGGGSWSAGVASCPEQPWDAARLVQRSQVAVVRARADGGERTVWSRPERRSSRRRAVGHGGLSASLPGRPLQRQIAIDDLSMSGALVRTDTRLAREERVTLALSGVSARSSCIALPARVVRAERTAGGAPDGDWSIGLQFTASEPLRSRIAGLLADLPPERSLPERRP